MATVQQQKKHSVLWQALKELEFISVFFSWLFLLMSRLAEPFMLLSAMYIIIEAGITQAANTFFHNLSVGAMITAPEVILPGAFILAAQARTQGKETRPLFVTCCLFVLLTLTTLLSLFVFHFSQDMINIIMFARCATGIGYSILVRIVTHTEQIQPQSQPQGRQPQPQIAAPEITPDHIALIVGQLKGQVSGIVAASVKTELETQVTKLLQNTSVLSSVPTTHAETKTGQGVPKIAVSTETEKRTPVPVPESGGNITLIRGKVSDEHIRESYTALLAKSANGKVTADALRMRAKIGKTRACQWLRSNTDQTQEVSA